MEKNLIQQAEDFAQQKHSNQKRKMSGIPYITHPIAVSNRIRDFVQDPTIIAAALLHDVLEDTETTIDELTKNFPVTVVNLVKELTSDRTQYQAALKDEKGNIISNEARSIMRLNLKSNYLSNKINNMSPEARLIKLSDREHNVSNLAHAEREFALKYAHETDMILKNISIQLNESESILIESIKEKITPFLPKN